MAISTPKSAYLRGVTGALPFLLVVIPFGMLFGVVGTEAGLNLAQVMGFTTLVIAGAAQFTAIQLMYDEAPTIVVIASALAVNLRMAMYAASLAPYLGQAPLWKRAIIAYLNVDQTYALSHQEFEAKPQLSLAARIAFFFGTATPILPMWIAATFVGAVLGAAIPPEFALDFAVPITFIALVAPGLRTLAHVAAALTSILLALTLGWIPHNLWILVAALGGMMVGAEIRAEDNAMTGWSDPAIWGIVAAMGFGTYLIRFSFLGLLGNRTFPDWVLRHLRYTAVTILPALITPMVLWPEATGGESDPARLAAATIAIASGYLTRNAIVAILCGMATLYLVQFVGF